MAGINAGTPAWRARSNGHTSSPVSSVNDPYVNLQRGYVETDEVNAEAAVATLRKTPQAGEAGQR